MVEAPDILGGRLSLGEDFQRHETGMNLKEGAGAGQTEKEEVVGFQAQAVAGDPRPQQVSWAAEEGDGVVEGWSKIGSWQA